MKKIALICISFVFFGCGSRDACRSPGDAQAASKEAQAARLEDLPATFVERDSGGKIKGVSSHSPFDDAAAASLSGSDQLEYLTLLGSPVSDHGIAQLGTLPLLTTLSLSGSRVTSGCFKDLVNFQSLQYLDVSDSRVDGAALKWIRKMKNLKTLVVTRSRMKKEDVDILREAMPWLRIED